MLTAIAVCALVGAAAAGDPPVAAGWTNIDPPPGARVFYVSSSSGRDSNDGTEASPFRSIARGYEALRDGQPDQMRLKCGDSWDEGMHFDKSAKSETALMVVASYGTGPRPRIKASGDAAFHCGQNRRGLAFVDLDFQGDQNGKGYSAITGFAPASNILIEGNRIDGFPTGIVWQEINKPERSKNVRIRRNVISNIVDTGTGHSQGVFIGNTDSLVVEGNVGYKIALNKANPFCHFAYLHESNGPSIFRDNIVAMTSSHAVQQRTGGVMTGNLSLRCPIGAFQGGSEANVFRNNVTLDSRDIRAGMGRGFGFVLGGGPDSVVEHNIAAFQTSGTDAVIAFNFDGWSGKAITGNVAWDWGAPGAENPGWVTAAQFDSGSGPVSITGNTFVHHAPSMIIRCERRGPAEMTLAGNKYFSTTPKRGVGGYMQFQVGEGQGRDWAAWKAATGDTSTFLEAAPAKVAAEIGDYLDSIEVARGADAVDTFMQRACKLSKREWDERFTAPVVTGWVRGKFGVKQPEP